MARRLVAAGHDVSVWNRSREKMMPLVDLGASAGDTPAEAVAGADAAITMVADPSALRAVTEGPSGIFEGVDDSSTVIEMSTVGPSAIARLASVAPDGVSLVDAPVLGSTSEAESGELKVFVGGSADAFERWSSLLSVFGAPIHVGPLGAGAAAKLVANLTLLGTLGIVGEALALADGLGLARDVSYQVLSGTPMGAQSERRRAAIETGKYPKRFALSLARKDADLVADAAEDAGVELRLASAARAWLADAVERGWGERDYSTVLAHIVHPDGRDEPSD